MLKRGITKLFLFLFFLISIVPAYSETEVKVGIYQNEPLMFSDLDNKPIGVLVEIIESIAKKEAWNIRYVHNAWLENLENGSVDILLGVGYSEPRALKYDFNKESLLSNWGQVYLHENSNINSIIDLSGKKTAALRDDIYYIFFKTVLEKFDINPHYIEVDNYAEILTLLDNQEVDAGILPRLYGVYHEKNHKIIKSAINFRPVKIHVVSLKGEHRDFLDTVDRHLSGMKKYKNSIYYRSQNYWIEGVRKVTFPSWLRPIWVFLFVILIIFLFFGGNIILGRVVRIRTEQLKESIAEKERITSELKIAHDIQMEMIPTIFPPFPGKNEFELFALLQPAKEVGGDFYDFFFIDKDNLCLIIGDVSGKGVPAALFMAMAKTSIKTTAKVIHSPHRIIESVNKEISEANDSCTFVTVFLAILNIKTGVMRYTNAGHNLPVIYSENSPPYFLNGAECPATGFDEDTPYTEETLLLHPGDAICMYTDGITESTNHENEEYSEERLMQKITDCRDQSMESIAGEILHDVNTFSGDKVAFDDITLLVLKYFGERK